MKQWVKRNLSNELFVSSRLIAEEIKKTLTRHQLDVPFQYSLPSLIPSPNISMR